MTRPVQWTIAAVATAMALGGYIWFMASRDRAPQISETTYPAGFNVTGDPATGRLCHEVVRRFPDGQPDRILKTHIIEGRDFRTGTEAEKKQWLQDDTDLDMEETSLSCYDEPWFFRPAYAQKHCSNCGGGCISWVCPANFSAMTGHCQVPGSDCAVSYYCCGSGCVASC